MPLATLTSKGQLTLPKSIRERLRVGRGDVVDFVITPDGEVHVRAGRFNAGDLRGMLKRAGRKVVSAEEMDNAIRDYTRTVTFDRRLRG